MNVSLVCATGRPRADHPLARPGLALCLGMLPANGVPPLRVVYVHVQPRRSRLPQPNQNDGTDR